jgi:dTDP-4-dehydrorhamnose reductase
MVLLLGASGYVGQAFARELRRRQWDFLPLARKTLDYTQFDLLFDLVRALKPEFLINAAGCAGQPNADTCEVARRETLHANTILPQTIGRVCLMSNTAWGHVSSGSIYHGVKVLEENRWVVDRRVNAVRMRQVLAGHPARVRGFTEMDEPNFSFLCPPCNFYCGTKALAEDAIRGCGCCYIWRPGVPFNEQDHPRNLLSKLQRYLKVYDQVNSLSHLADFTRASLDLWERRASPGIYNIATSDVFSARQVVQSIQRWLLPEREFRFWRDEEEFYRFGARAPRSSCLLDTTKLAAAGIQLRPAEEALEDALRNWRWASPAWELASC